MDQIKNNDNNKKRVAICTLGCKVNQYESNAIMQEFIDKGYKIVEFEEKADIYIVNTCTVTNMADKKSRQMLRRTKEINSNSILVVTGCYAQVSKEKLEKMPEIDLILGVNEKNNLIEHVENYLNNQVNNNKDEKNKKENIKNAIVTDVMHQNEFLDFGEVTYTEKTRAVIKVQDGCNQFCSYCIIPYARGRIRSRNPENVIKEITKIAKEGIKEVVITGIHLASYGRDFENKYLLIDLLEDIQKIEGIERIRLGSLEPTLITEEFANRLSKLTKICDHFHLSLQSGCDETLKRMNRKYNTIQFKEGTEILRKTFPNVHLTTDVIVGFPGETEEEFNKTYKFLEDIKFYKMHIFKYSRRDGTLAAKMPNQIDGKVQEERSQKLIKLSNILEEKYNEEYEGEKVEVLWEEPQDDYITGHTKNYMFIKKKIADVKGRENDIEEVVINKGDIVIR